MFILIHQSALVSSSYNKWTFFTVVKQHFSNAGIVKAIGSTCALTAKTQIGESYSQSKMLTYFFDRKKKKNAHRAKTSVKAKSYEGASPDNGKHVLHVHDHVNSIWHVSFPSAVINWKIKMQSIHGSKGCEILCLVLIYRWQNLLYSNKTINLRSHLLTGQWARFLATRA